MIPFGVIPKYLKHVTFKKFDLQTVNHVTQGLSQAVLFKTKKPTLI